MSLSFALILLVLIGLALLVGAAFLILMIVTGLRSTYRTDEDASADASGTNAAEPSQRD